MLPREARNVLRVAGIRNESQADFRVTGEVIRTQREASYVGMWKAAYENRWFHILFEDLSIIQFQATPSPSFHFIECPLNVPTLADFLHESGRDVRSRHDGDITDEYAMVVETAELRQHMTPIRYDYDSNSYRCGVHPAAHIHIGLDNQVRIAVEREMTPLSFLLFVLRQRYPYNWVRLLESPMATSLERNIRGGLVQMPKRYFQESDLFEVYLA